MSRAPAQCGALDSWEICFVTARLAGLALERPDLPLHFADEIGDAQKILVGVFQFAERFLFLALVFGNAGGFLENQAPVFRLAGKESG